MKERPPILYSQHHVVTASLVAMPASANGMCDTAMTNSKTVDEEMGPLPVDQTDEMAAMLMDQLELTGSKVCCLKACFPSLSWFEKCATYFAHAPCLDAVVPAASMGC